MDQQQDIRQAAELLASATYNIQTPTLDISHSHSINTISSLHPDHVISEDLLAGQRFQGRMSNVRRFFCLFVTFDLLFTGLMWLICVMLNGENLMKALSEQIVHYSIHKSLFDIVLVAVCRFTALLLFYAVLYINHWIVISLSTALTCAFLIGKVFVYDWPHSTQPVFEVLLVLISFVLSWGEAWFLDFKVLPQENLSSRYLINNQESERAPLIQNYIQRLPQPAEESVYNFYSPYTSPDGSIHRFVSENPSVHSPRPSHISQMSTEEEQKYRSQAAEALQEAWDLLKTSVWTFETTTANGDFFESRLAKKPRKGKMFRLTGIIDAPPKFILDELFFQVDKVTEWQPDIIESRKVQVIDEHTDITYQCSGSNGVISCRDFVNIRHWQCIEGTYVLALKATEHPSVPPVKKCVRGLNVIVCFAIKPTENDPNTSHIQWILHTDPKVGLVPHVIIETATTTMMFDFIKNLREHLALLKKEEKF